MNNEEFEKELKRVEQVLTELRIKFLESKATFIPYKPYEVEVPEDIDYYFTKAHDGLEYLLLKYDKEKRCDIYKRGLAFKNSEDLKKYEKERILLFKMHNWAEEHNEGWYPDWENDDDKFSIYYYHSSESFSVFSDWNCNSFGKLPCFKSEELAREFIEEFGDEIKEVLL